MPKLLHGRWASDVTIVDAFAGSGRYRDGLDGSAVMIAKLFREHQFHDRFRSLDFVTLEKDPRRVVLLNERITELPDDPLFLHSPQPPGEFENEWRRIMTEHAPEGRPTLWILDPWGFQIPWTGVSACAARRKNEVVVTFSTLSTWAAREGFMESHVRTALGILFDEARVIRVHPVASRTPWPTESQIQVFDVLTKSAGDN